jgi:hypothetical protein
MQTIQPHQFPYDIPTVRAHYRLKVAKARGLTVPQTFLITADEVIVGSLLLQRTLVALGTKLTCQSR